MERKIRKIRKNSIDESAEECEPEKELKDKNDIELDKISKSGGFERTHDILYRAARFMYRLLIYSFRVSRFYLLWICLHYFASQLYIKFCVPTTLFGFIMSPFVISTPHCRGLRWVIYNAAEVINNMWILVGAWIYSLIWFVKDEAAGNV